MITDVRPKSAVVSVDWFSLSCRLTREWKDVVLAPPVGCSVVKLTQTAVWSERWYVLTPDGNKLCTILACPRSWKIASDRCVIEVANRWLYYDDFDAVLDRILEIVPVVVESLNRVDLCCDFEMSKAMFNTYKKMADGRAYVGAYKTGVCWWRDSGAGRFAHQLSWGGKDSTLHWKVYYKYLELEEAAPDAKKDYIVDLWRRAGFEPKNVWRCEVSIAGSKSLSDVINGTPVPPREWYRRRAELWVSLYVSRFIVRLAQGHKDKRNDKVLTFIPVDGVKVLCTAKPSSTRDVSDPERRLLSKLWDEWRSVDVEANRPLWEMLKSDIMRLCERASNWSYLVKVSQMSEADLMNAFVNAPTSPVRSTE